MKKYFIIMIVFNLTYANAKINAIVSIPPLLTYLKAIAQDKVNASVMVDESKSAHSYTPKPSQMKDVSKANLYFSIGIEFENIWLEKFAKLNTKMHIVNTHNSIKKLNMSNHVHKNDEHDGHDENDEKKEKRKSLDPHIWTSSKNVKIISKNILNALIKYDSKNKEFYTINYNKFVKKVQNTNSEIKSILSVLPKHTKFMVFHPSWQYFAKEYNLEQISIEKEGKNPKPKALKNLIELAKKNNISSIFASPNISNKHANIIAKELNIKVVKITPMSQNWSENLINLANHIANKNNIK